jgi:hypothetical protein
VTRVYLSIAWSHLTVLPRVPRPYLRCFTTSLPTTLPPLYPNTRSAEIPNSSLLLIATRNFKTFRTKVSTSYPLKCRNAKISTRHQRGSHNRTSDPFGVLDFTTSRILMLIFWFFKPRNPKILSFDALHQ